MICCGVIFTGGLWISMCGEVGRDGRRIDLGDSACRWLNRNSPNVVARILNNELRPALLSRFATCCSGGGFSRTMPWPAATRA